jgi:hypothetical protein
MTHTATDNKGICLTLNLKIKLVANMLRAWVHPCVERHTL